MALSHNFHKNFSMRKVLLCALLLGGEERLRAHIGLQLAQAVGVGCAGAALAYGAYVVYKRYGTKDYDTVEFLPWLRREYVRFGQSRIVPFIALWAAATLGQLPQYGMHPGTLFLIGALSEVLSIVGWNCVESWWVTWRFHQQDGSHWYKMQSEQRDMVDTLITKVIPATGRILMTALIVSYILYYRTHMPYATIG
jgi:hypothetical protein